MSGDDRHSVTADLIGRLERWREGASKAAWAEPSRPTTCGEIKVGAISVENGAQF